MPPHPLTNFEIQKYYQNGPRINGVYSRDNIAKIKDGAYIIDLDENSDIGTHWIAFYCFALIVWEHSIFQKKLNHLLVIKP